MTYGREMRDTKKAVRERVKPLLSLICAVKGKYDSQKIDQVLLKTE
jgi:hypothetical protein